MLREVAELRVQLKLAEESRDSLKHDLTDTSRLLREGLMPTSRYIRALQSVNEHAPALTSCSFDKHRVTFDNLVANSVSTL